jgi:hypothetical protein
VSWTVILRVDIPGQAAVLAAPWLGCGWVERLVVLPPAADGMPPVDDPRVNIVPCPDFIPGERLAWLLEDAGTPYIAVVQPVGPCEPEESFPRRFAQALAAPGAGLRYGHYRVPRGDAWEDFVLPRFQAGSARDTFPTGPVWALGMDAARTALRAGGPLEAPRWGGLFELFLRLARAGAVALLPESLYRVRPPAAEDAHRRHFDYLLPEHRSRQLELERIFTSHLRALGAWLPPPAAPVPEPAGAFPVEASVVIPVRNRVRTIGEALASAATQACPFPFNVLVVDNHSTDGTAGAIEAARNRFPRVHRLVPPRPGHGIGGCWQLAVQSELCGRYAVQLDSDDLYEGPGALRRMVECLRDSRAALAVGSYRVVDRELREIPPGVIDHREWTPENGHNNLLRVEGIGAPRAFHVPAIREAGFPDVSYGEDYAAALALSRRWPVGRVFEPLYLCRRWEGNSDSGLTSLQQARHHEYKDSLRTIEIGVRQSLAPRQSERRTSNIER